RHTRSTRDWSSDVCSSDLRDRIMIARHAPRLPGAWRPIRKSCWRESLADPVPGLPAAENSAEDAALNPQGIRALHRDGGIVSLEIGRASCREKRENYVDAA